MRDIFEGLNDIPWAELSSAYGNTDEIPAWIRQLASKDEYVRSQAAWRLANELEHQYTVYAASAAAIPFLTRLLREPDIQDKADIMHLLGIVAYAARDFVNYYADGEVVYGPDGLPEGETVAHVLGALRAGIPVYVSFLADDDVRVRMHAADVVSLSDVSEIATHLRAAYRHETTETGRANVVLALARQSPSTDEETRFFLGLLRSRTESMLCSAAALALLHSIPAAAPEDAITLLGQVLASEADTRDFLDSLPCLHDFSEAIIRSTLQQVDPTRLRVLLPALLRGLRQAKEMQGAELVDILTYILFDAHKWTGNETRPVASLTHEQRESLETVVFSPGAWEWGNWLALHRYGLPTDRESLAAYLEVALPPDIPDDGPAESAFDAAIGRFQEAGDRILDEVISDRAVDGIRAIGWRSDSQNNVVMTVNDTLLFRFPKHAQVIDEMERELRLLRALQGNLPLPIPDPIYSSLEPREVGQAFMGYAKLPGKPLYREMLESVPGEETVQRLAEQLGGFLRALHSLPVDEVCDFELPAVGAREQWVGMYAGIREKLFALMRPDAREQVTAHFERALDDPTTFAYTPALVHGDFGAGNILYDARARSISGIIDWSSAGLGDPALDLAALICPVSYGEAFAQRLTGVYAAVEKLLPRARFYIGTFALQEALFGAERDDADALARGLADYK